MQESLGYNETSDWAYILQQRASDKNIDKHFLHIGKKLNLKEGKNSGRIYQGKISIAENIDKRL